MLDASHRLASHLPTAIGDEGCPHQPALLFDLQVGHLVHPGRLEAVNLSRPGAGVERGLGGVGSARTQVVVARWSGVEPHDGPLAGVWAARWPFCHTVTGVVVATIAYAAGRRDRTTGHTVFNGVNSRDAEPDAAAPLAARLCEASGDASHYRAAGLQPPRRRGQRWRPRSHVHTRRAATHAALLSASMRSAARPYRCRRTRARRLERVGDRHRNSLRRAAAR